jgi:hypothetical protein
VGRNGRDWCHRIGIAAALLAAPTVRWRWLSWLWLAPVFRMIGCVYLILPWFRL